MQLSTGTRSFTRSELNTLIYVKVNSLNLQSALDFSSPPGLATPLLSNKSNGNGHIHQYSPHSSLFPQNVSPFSMNGSNRMRRPNLAPIPAVPVSRPGLGMSYEHLPSADNGRTSSTMTADEYASWSDLEAGGAIPMEGQIYWPDTGMPYPTSFAIDYQGQPAYSSSFFPKVSPKTRYLPHPEDSRDLSPRSSVTNSFNQGRRSENTTVYSGDQFDLERALSQTSRGSVTSQSQDPTSTCSSSPRDFQNSLNTSYNLMAQPAPQAINSRMPGYHSLEPTTTLDQISPSMRTHSHSSFSPALDCHQTRSIDHHRGSYNTDYNPAGSNSYRALRPQPRNTN